MQVWGATLPKPMVKTPPITVEKWAIGMWTPKANNTPVIPPKATVAPSVSAPKKVVSKYIPWETDISNYSLWEYRDLVKEQYPWIHTEKDIQRMYKTLQDEWTITKAPKKWMPKLWKEILEQNITQWDNLIQEAKKYKSADEFINDHKKLFHTTSESNAQRIDAEWFIEWKSQWIWDRLVDWVFFVDNEMPLSTITRYSKEPSKIIEWFVSRWSKIKEFKTMDNFEDFLLKDKKYLDLENADLSSKRAKEIFIENWIDVVIKPYWKGTEYIVVNPKVLRTKSQPKQIREEANKKSLPPLPKKWLPKLWKEIIEQNPNQQVEKIWYDLELKYPVKIDIYPKWKDRVSLSKIEVNKWSRNSWIWTKVMNEIIDRADNNNITITLTPDTALWSSKWRLIEFYKRLWFKSNTGRSRDLAISDTFIRLPSAWK